MDKKKSRYPTMDKDKLLEFAGRLKSWRLSLHLSQAKLAAIIGCNPITIYRIEKARSAPTDLTMARLVDYFKETQK